MEQAGSGGQAIAFLFYFPLFPPAAGRSQIDSPLDLSLSLASFPRPYPFDTVSNQGAPKQPLTHCKNPFFGKLLLAPVGKATLKNSGVLGKWERV